ncbi:DNA repair protein rad2 [Rhodosporidiobolus nylandii]
MVRGVHGLWQLVSPCARPIQLETLARKRLAIDASIWLYQFQMAMRDRKTGDTLQGAHIMGTFRRIMKLLFHGIKPVFVFDGDAPMLKKRTIEKRRRRKEGAGRDLAKTAQQLLAAQLRGAVAEKELNRRRKDVLDKQDGEVDTGDQIGEGAVYLEDLEAPSPVKAARKDPMRDEYALPKINGPLEARAKASDPRIATEEELREFIEDLRPEDLDINSSFFGNLPTEVKYEILGDLRIKTRQVNHRRVQTMREHTAVDFSRAQIDNLMQRNLYTQRLLDVTDELGRAAIAIPTRVAGQRNREYILVKQDVSKGGGWVLGVKNPQVANDEPITLDTTTDESVGGHTDTDEFEEVGVESTPEKKLGLPTPDVEARRLLAVEAVRARYASNGSSTAADPYLDQPVASTSRAGAALFGSNPIADEDDVALQQALFESAQQVASSPDLPRRPLPVPPPPVASTSRLSYVPPTRPPLADTGNETDESMEYVAVPVSAKGKEKAREEAPIVLKSDTDDSDAFEEVDVAAPTAPAALAAPTANAPPASRPHSRPSSRLPSTRTSPAPALSPTATAPAHTSRSIFDSILPSDSDSGDERSPRKPPPSATASRPAPVRHPPRLSPSPDPFAEFDAAPAKGVQAQDFAFEQQQPSPSRPSAFALEPDPDFELPTPAPVSAFSRPAASPPPFDSAAPPDPPPSQPHSPSPVDLPAPFPPLEKTQEAVEAEEAAVLPATIAQLPSPRLRARPPSPPSLATAPPSEAPSAPVFMRSSPRAQEVELSPPARRSQSPRPLPAAAVEMAASPVELARAAAEPGAPPPADGSEPEEFFSDWSRSPSPPGGRRGSGDALFLPEEEYDSDAEAEEAARALQDEEAAYADVVAQLRNEKLEKMKNEAETEMQRLQKQKNTEQRNADGVTRAMATDIKEMLILFGIPYIDAPQEAEAECASLLTRQLVDGIVTDDSDVFLFGGSRIYRNMFNESKYVECYLLDDLEREVGLDRDKLVRLAHLLGSDYTDGLPGVGPVQGMELLEEFPGENGLKKFKEWWASVQSGKDKKETNTQWRRKFRSSHKKLIIDATWPSTEVTNAYYRPTVQESDEAFTWSGVDLDGLRLYLARTLGWDQIKSDQLLLPLIQREQKRNAGTLKEQAQITNFFDVSAGYKPFAPNKKPKYASKRLQNVVQSWKSKNQPQDDAGKLEELDEEAEEEEAAQPAKTKRKTKAPPKKPAQPKKKKSTPASRKRAAKAQKDARAAARGGEYSSDEDFDQLDQDGADAAEPKAKKKRTREQPARKKRKTATRVVAPSDDDEEE